MLLLVSCSQCPAIYGCVTQGSTNELAGPLPAIMLLFYLCCSFTPKAGTQKCVGATQNYSFYLL